MTPNALLALRRAMDPNSVGAMNSAYEGNGFGADEETPDPLGIRIQRRGMDSYLQGTADAARAGTLGSVVVPTMDQAGLQQAYTEKNVGKIKAAPLSEAEENPAGMTTDAALASADAFRKGGALPDWYDNATAQTQDAFRQRVLAGIRRAQK